MTAETFIEMHSAILRLAILPRGLSDVIGASKAHLNQFLFNLLPTTQYLLLGYDDLELLSQTAALSYQSSHIHLTLKCSLILFKPQLNALIHAQIKQIWPKFIHLLFRGSIPVHIVDPGAKYVYAQGAYYDKETREQLLVNMVLQVRIKSFGIQKSSYVILCSMDDPEYRIVQRPELAKVDSTMHTEDNIDGEHSQNDNIDGYETISGDDESQLNPSLYREQSS